MMDTLTTNTIELNGACYHVKDSERGKDCVLLIHGWPDDSTVWKHQVTALIENGYRVICPDLLGYGLSEAPTDVSRYQLANLVNDMITLLDRMGVAEVHCVAHDYGAVLGWELAAHAKQLKSYTAMSVGHLAEFLKLSHENLRFQWIYFLNIHNLAPQLYRANNGQFFHEVLRTHPNREQLVENIVKPGVFENMQKLEKANPVAEYLLAALAGQLPKPVQIQVPTLGIWSTKDDFLWESQMKDSEQYVSAQWQYERIEGAGHWFMLERSQQVNQLLLNWLAKHT
ncbi:alpha/beta fold hydrolase [Scytonema sp. UIC 10036]|uniref:alpha/beta fold hydrolase n=1 Tax=Scytonema sp. UIC 10036 TaxID=2304196 RepID=UPI0012DA4B08|nr:alpha/beta hydrolase [Scytonema sp. UIC 10036]MUG97093.1 alpha/beta fold hydrolase [Scytonema sp. UIC 10036]